MAMSDEHRAALKRGRQESAAIRRYLEAIESRRPGRPVTAESLGKRLEGLASKLEAERNPLKRVELEQQRIDTATALAAVKNTADTSALENDFVKYAKSYSQRKGISYAAWRTGGVSAAALQKAGITRSGK